MDIALCTLNPDPRVYEFKSISRQMICSKETIEKLEIAEGDDVFFSGLFESHIGQRKNQPIVRFGRVALMSDEKIEWKEKGRSSKQLDLYLLECQSFGGNSGSPVFFHLNPLRNLRQIDTLDPAIYLAGIIMGSFQNTEIYYDILLRQNMGIAAVTPSYKLLDIIDSKKVKEARNHATEYAKYS